MERIELPACGFAVSRFAFGCARLFRAGPKNLRANLLAQAADCGFSHFDVAPSYGFGMAERDLAPLLKQRPDLTVATKVGLYAPGGEDGGGSEIFLRKAAGLVFPALSKTQVDFSLARAENALDGSLRRLGRSHVDLLLLHAPRLDLIAIDEWRSWLEHLVIAGKARAFGLAATSIEAVEEFLDHCPALAPVIQCPDSLDRREADRLRARNHPPQLAYGYLATARQREPQRAVAEVLEQALARNPRGAIIVSTLKRQHLQAFAQIAVASEFSANVTTAPIAGATADYRCDNKNNGAAGLDLKIGGRGYLT